MSDWHLYRTNASTESTPTVTTADGAVDDLADTTNPAPEPPVPQSESMVSSSQSAVSSSQSAVPLNQSVAVPSTVTPAQPSATLNQQYTTQSGVALDYPGNVSNQLGHASDQFCTNSHSGDVPPQPDRPHTPVTANAALPAANSRAPPPILNTIDPSLLLIAEPQPVTPGQPRSQVATGLLESPQSNRLTARLNVISPPEPLAGVADEPLWMKKKRTLNYFRSAVKFGSLSDVIRHWYELEGLLGFQEVVSVPRLLILLRARKTHDIQTPAGFPTERRPAVIRLFHKNAHNYKRDYGVEVHTLGHQIMGWWSEICPPDGVPNIKFGGPTGIYALVVLMSWWCSLLKNKPDEEHTDCLRTLEDIDRVLQMAIKDIKNQPETLSPTTPLPSQSRKRANTEETTSQKRMRSV